jgi:cobalamin-dependent methionine synthase I
MGKADQYDGTRKQVSQAIQNRDSDFIRNLATRQFENGATYIDVNADHPSRTGSR